MKDLGIHIVIPDTQAKPGVPDDHLYWAGRYIGENYVGRPNLTVIGLGDHHDLPSLSRYDGKREMENRRLAADITAGNDAWGLLTDSIRTYGPRSRRKPRLVKLRGNHENRLERYLSDHPEVDGALPSFDDHGWEVHPFLEVVTIDGVSYSHYFYNPNTGRPYGGSNVETRLKTVGTSFTMGHQQGLLYGVRSTMRGMQHGLVCGSFYQHNEDYRGPQATGEWRGIVICHDVRDGHYDPMFVSLSYLERRYGKRKVG